MFQRRILHHGSSLTGTPVLLDDRALGGCWFELHRLGGCGAGEIILQRELHERDTIQIGDWISCEPQPGVRWYLGRVEETRYQHPGRLRLRLAGMVAELNEVFPGGFDATPDERRPIRYGDTDLFSNDPDRDWEIAHNSPTVEALVRQLMLHHVVGRTHVNYVPTLVESPSVPLKALSVKFRGEESIRSILKDLALRAQADWGVDAFGRFFFLQRRTQVQRTFRIGRDLTSVEQVRDRELIFNRLLLTGDYIYDHRDNSGQIARRVYRWRANYFEPDSCQRFGNRRLRLWVPWIRTQADSIDFAREFFRTYSRPIGRYLVETIPQDSLMIPWEGPVALENSNGAPLASGIVERVRVQFDHAPRFRLEIGPEDPREQWPEPPQDERWEIPDHVPSHGGDVSITSLGSSGGGGGGGQSTDDRFSTSSSNTSSDVSSDASSSHGSSESSDQSYTSTNFSSNPNTSSLPLSSSAHSPSSSDDSEWTSTATSSHHSTEGTESDSSLASSLTSNSTSSTPGHSTSSSGIATSEPSSENSDTEDSSTSITSELSSSTSPHSTSTAGASSSGQPGNSSDEPTSCLADDTFTSSANSFTSSLPPGTPSSEEPPSNGFTSDTDENTWNSQTDTGSTGPGHISSHWSSFLTNISTFSS